MNKMQAKLGWKIDRCLLSETSPSYFSCSKIAESEKHTEPDLGWEGDHPVIDKEGQRNLSKATLVDR